MFAFRGVLWGAVQDFGDVWESVVHNVASQYVRGVALRSVLWTVFVVVVRSFACL